MRVPKCTFSPGLFCAYHMWCSTSTDRGGWTDPRQIGADLSRSPALGSRSPALGPVLAGFTADELRERDYLLVTGPIPGIRGTRSSLPAGLNW
jgi:hypothetical protein